MTGTIFAKKACQKASKFTKKGQTHSWAEQAFASFAAAAQQMLQDHP